jgi:hypothetical protein
MDVAGGPRPEVTVYQVRRGVRWRRVAVRVAWTLVVVLALAAAEIGLLRLLRDHDPWAGAQRATPGTAVPKLSEVLDSGLVGETLAGIGARRVQLEEGPAWLLGRASRVDATFRVDGRRLDATFAVAERHPAVAERIGDGRARLERVDGYDVLVDRFAGVRRLDDVAVITCQGVTIRVDDPVAKADVPPPPVTLAAQTAVDLVRDTCPPAPPVPADAVTLRLHLAADVDPATRQDLAAQAAGTQGVLAVQPVRWEDAARFAASREPAANAAERLRDTLVVRLERGARDDFLTGPATAEAVAGVEDESAAPALVAVRPRPEADLALLERELRADPEVAVVTFRSEERARSRFAGAPTAGNPDARAAFLVWLRTGGDPTRADFIGRAAARPDVEGAG